MSKKDKILPINVPFTIIGGIVVSIGCYYLSACIDLYADDKVQGVIDRIEEIEANPFGNYFSWLSVIFILIGVFFYGIYILYKTIDKMRRMPDREYGNSKLESPFFITKKLADLNKDANDPQNIAISVETYGPIQKLVIRWKNRNAD